MPKGSQAFPSQPVDEYDRPVPKKAFGRVLDDDRPIDDFENTVYEEEARKRAEKRGPSPPNRAAARNRDGPHQPHGREGTTTSKYRSVSKH